MLITSRAFACTMYCAGVFQAISSAMERKLYDLCRRFRISCITISHRPALREFHDIQLTILGDETCGYELDRLPATSSNRGGFGAEESKEEQPISDGTASATDSLLSASQLREKYALDNAHSKTHTQSKQQLVSKSPKAKTPFVVSLHNMWTMFRLGISREISFGAGRRVRYADAKVVAILAGIAASIVAQATILIYGTGTFAKMMRAVFAQDRPHFHRLLLQGTLSMIVVCSLHLCSLLAFRRYPRDSMSLIHSSLRDPVFELRDRICVCGRLP